MVKYFPNIKKIGSSYQILSNISSKSYYNSGDGLGVSSLLKLLSYFLFFFIKLNFFIFPLEKGKINHDYSIEQKIQNIYFFRLFVFFLNIKLFKDPMRVNRRIFISFVTTNRGKLQGGENKKKHSKRKDTAAEKNQTEIP